MKKYFLSFQTVFRLNENVKWLEEFLVYYLNLGVDHFYLYNNDGSISEFNQNKNKYGHPISNDENPENQKLFDKIMQKYGDKITYTRWKPLNDEGNIVYGQDYATMDFIKRYANETEWVALMDVDEFLFSANKLEIVEYLKNLPANISCVYLGQKKFVNRFQTDERFVTQDFRAGEYLPPGRGGSKNIVRTIDFVDLDAIQGTDISEFAMDKVLKCEKLKQIDSTWNLHLHFVQVTKERIIPTEFEFRFNHYNENDMSKLTSVDDGMRRYRDLFDNIGSDSDKNESFQVLSYSTFTIGPSTMRFIILYIVLLGLFVGGVFYGKFVKIHQKSIYYMGLLFLFFLYFQPIYYRGD